MASRTKRSAPIRRASISNSAATRRTSTSWAIRATTSRSPGAFWRELNALTQEFDQPGRFVCIPGYEWSANTAVGGDRNVHYRHEGETIHRSSHAQIADAADIADERSDAHDARELFEKLKGKDCVVAAHVGGRYADIKFAHDGTLETAVEVHSAWGTFEWILHDAFEKNFRVGIFGNSDGHKGRPGACFPGASFFGSQGGLTCFLAERLDRDAIFESMRRRRHYATTGNRAFVDVAVELASDGEVFERDPALRQAQIAKDAAADHGRHRAGERRRGRIRHRRRGVRAASSGSIFTTASI